MLEVVKISERRKGALIGDGGAAKKLIEKKTGTMIRVSDAVEITGEPLSVMKAKDVVRAVGRGFSLEKALMLLGEETMLVVISLEGKKEKAMNRLKARVIGRDGKARRTIERLTGTDICIFGKTISIIGGWEKATKAEKAVEMLLGGKTHAYVYKCIEGEK